MRHNRDYTERIRNILLGLMLICTSSAFAQSKWEVVDNLRKAGDYQAIINLLMSDAQTGDDEAINVIGNCYWAMDNMSKSIWWYEKGASNNNARCLFNLGLIYDANQNAKTPNVTKNIELAKKYYLQAAATTDNSVDAKYWAVVNYALILRKVEKQKEKAVEFLRKYINQDTNYTPHHYLCQILLEDKEDGSNYREALNIYRKLAVKKDLYSMFWLGREYMHGNDNKLDKDEEEAIKWLTSVAESDDDYNDGWGSIKGRAWRYLGYIYEELYRKHNSDIYLRLALKWCSRNYGDPFSTDLLEKLYADGVYYASEYPVFDDWCSFLQRTFSFDSDVDYNIPNREQTNLNTFVLIIANEHYEYESPVLYAERDGRIIAKYCSSVLGIPQEHITFISDCSLNKMKFEIDLLEQKAKSNSDSRVIFYYAGHGVPAENQTTSYLLPVDGYARNVSTGLDVSVLYRQLGQSHSQTIVLLDACFSGAKRDGDMLVASRGVAIKPKEQELFGKMVVMSACKGDETALQYSDQQHGLFTYFFLKKLQESQGECTLGELDDYVSTNVSNLSIVINGKSQTPNTRVSQTLLNGWRTIKLR